jgi:hypothetical protein
MNETKNDSRWVCVWEFRSVDGKQVVQSVRTAYADDYQFQSDYQRIIYRGPERDWERRAA